MLVKVSILDNDPRILPEMGAQVVFESENGAAATPRRAFVPRDAIVSARGETSVWVVENGKARAQAVTLGPDRGDRIEVRSGLAGGENVVLSPPARLAAGSRVMPAAK